MVCREKVDLASGLSFGMRSAPCSSPSRAKVGAPGGTAEHRNDANEPFAGRTAKDVARAGFVSKRGGSLKLKTYAIKRYTLSSSLLELMCVPSCAKGSQTPLGLLEAHMLQCDTAGDGLIHAANPCLESLPHQIEIQEPREVHRQRFESRIREL